VAEEIEKAKSRRTGDTENAPRRTGDTPDQPAKIPPGAASANCDLNQEYRKDAPASPDLSHLQEHEITDGTQRPTGNSFDSTGPCVYDTLSGARLRPLTLDTHALPEQLGHWRICNLVGRGGMGEVWRAERADGLFEMNVAVKFLRSDRADVLERFKAERRVLAQLDHPNIARLIDGGVTQNGLPYLVTEFIEGAQLDRWCEHKRPKLRERLNLFLQICDALAYAHSELVVHRDIKPGNILIDANGTAHLLDFGIAKVLSGPGLDELTDESPHTPEYAAPEQVQGGAITVRTDVYALGLLLYWLLTGVRPQARGGPLAEQIERILEHVPALPSAVVGLQTHALVAASELQGDLDSIVAKAIQKNPIERFISVAEFATDVRAYLAGRPIAARRSSKFEQAIAYLRRNAALVSAASIAGLLLFSAAGVALYQAGRARESAAETLQKQDLARTREDETLAARAFISALLKDVELQGAAGPELARRSDRYAATTLANFPELQAGVIWEVAGAYSNFGLYAEREAMLREAGQSTEARRLLRAADALLKLTTQSTASVETDAWATLDCARIGGRALRYLGEYERAELQITQAAAQMRLRYANTAVTPARGINDVRHSQYVDILNGLAIAQIQAAHFQAALRTLQELAALLRAQGREQSNQMANVYGNLASAQRALGEYARARANADLGLALQRKRDPNALNPSTLCVRAQLAQHLNEPTDVTQALVRSCKAQISADQYGPKLSARQCWAELAEIAGLSQNQTELDAAATALENLAKPLSASERRTDMPLLRLALVKAQRKLQLHTLNIGDLGPLLQLDAGTHSSVMPIKAGALALAIKTANARRDKVSAMNYLRELRTLTHSEYPQNHPVFRDLTDQ
jgi:hypothetical protein